jgi:plasmid stabilization system protein ParE
MKSRLAGLAIKDVDEILGSLARESPTAANGFRGKVAEVRALIEQFPSLAVKHVVRTFAS